MAIFFISDLHLSPTEPEKTALFMNFLAGQAKKAKALYILGDLFEFWIGDDENSPFAQQIIQGLKAYSEQGIPLYVMRGNRDFLLGTRFETLTGCQLLGDYHVVDLYGTPTLLMHGDLLCTEDVKYLQARLVFHNPLWQQRILKKPLWLRRLGARYFRLRSRWHTRNSTAMIMDANINEIHRIMAHHQVSHLIHGHTHRPAIHYFKVNNEWKQRIVLSDWHEEGNMLVCEDSGRQLLVNCSLSSL